MFAVTEIELTAGIGIYLAATSIAIQIMNSSSARYLRCNPLVGSFSVQIHDELPRQRLLWFSLALLSVLSIPQSYAQSTVPPKQESAPLPTPSMTGPLTMSAPTAIDAGPFGTLDITGILSGLGYAQSDPEKDDSAARADISNGTLFVQRTKGLMQFFVQAGAYNLPALGSPITSTATTINNDFGPLPVAYLKISPNDKLSFLAGKLPTLMGMENTFTFQNFNIERGLLWNQTNAVTRGVQMNYTGTVLSSSVSWNDGFYSNRYNWLTDTETYTPNKSSALALSVGGNLGSTGYSRPSTPLYQNNSGYLDLAYTYTSKRWMIEPYLQLTRVPSGSRTHLAHTTDTLGGAIFATYTLHPDISLVGRAEFIGSSGSPTDNSANLIYGSGSQAWSLTLTPTYQKHGFFARPEFSFVHALNAVQGDSFGTNGNNLSQARFMLETGIVF